MRCGACAQAICGGAEYRIGCMGCAARAIARSHVMQQAMDSSLPQMDRLQAGSELRQAISRAMPHVQYDEARAAVLSWWRADEPVRAARTT